MRAKARSTHSAGGETIAVPGLPYMPGQVTSENFVDKALAYMRASGRSNGEHPVVRRDDDDPTAWLAWLAFFRQIGKTTAVAEQYGVLTIPAAFPWEFSVDADGLRDIRVGPRSAEQYVGPQRRRELAEMLRGSVPRSTYVPPRRRPMQPYVPGEPVPPLSSELRARMGLADDLPEERT